MIVFGQKQIEILKLHCNGIAKSCGVSSKYVHYLVEGKRKQNTQKSKEIIKKAKAILDIVESL